MDEIEFTKEGITLRELVTAFGETKTEEMEIQYEEREGWEIDFDSNLKSCRWFLHARPQSKQSQL